MRREQQPRRHHSRRQPSHRRRWRLQKLPPCKCFRAIRYCSPGSPLMRVSPPPPNQGDEKQGPLPSSQMQQSDPASKAAPRQPRGGGTASDGASTPPSPRGGRGPPAPLPTLKKPPHHGCWGGMVPLGHPGQGQRSRRQRGPSHNWVQAIWQVGMDPATPLCFSAASIPPRGRAGPAERQERKNERSRACVVSCRGRRAVSTLSARV